jgi:hypothetical protein
MIIWFLSYDSPISKRNFKPSQGNIKIDIEYTEQVRRLSSKMYPVEVSKSIYSVLFSMQRISDHIVNIAFSVRSTTGSKTEALKAIEREKKGRKA